MPHFTPRKYLFHTPPDWIDTTKAHYFITICCQPRYKNQLANPEIASAIYDGLNFRIKRSLLYPYLFLLMPDHLHAIIGYNAKLEPLDKLIASFKQRLAQQHGIKWQKGFFDHRLRNDDSYEEKTHYILQNPVRAELCETAEEWPYKWFANDFR
ncbi:REP-associated tyrosine transposase [Pelagicoccus albus]|uniref:Transposase n=1 Tax=Pelagicoccus albus TaxID=415222 RepID=A0A7X1E9K2_9BACT|nr:transposase [Pelagicoccus albus]MBC2607293.1 transposase [Pelagicoccus albus]